MGVPTILLTNTQAIPLCPRICHFEPSIPSTRNGKTPKVVDTGSLTRVLTLDRVSVGSLAVQRGDSRTANGLAEGGQGKRHDAIPCRRSASHFHFSKTTPDNTFLDITVEAALSIYRHRDLRKTPRLNQVYSGQSEHAPQESAQGGRHSGQLTVPQELRAKTWSD